MRKLRTVADIERVRRRNNIILGVAMIVLLVGSSLGYSLMSADGGNSNSVNEMGFDFVRDAGGWKTVVAGQVFGFKYLPSEVSDVDVNLNIQMGMYSEQPLYFVNPGEGVSEILNTFNRYILRYQEACLASDGMTSVGSGNETICEGDLPVKDCSSNLIVFIPQSGMTQASPAGNGTTVYGEDSCVFIVGDASRGSDAFLYEVLGIS